MQEALIGSTPYTLKRFPHGQPTQGVISLYGSLNDLMRQTNDLITPYWAPHVEASRRYISQVAAGLQGRALIVGAGNAMEIPLEVLAAQFDRVTLMDMDQIAMTRAVERLPLPLQEKIEIIVDDITGVTGGVINQIAGAARRERKFNRFVSRFADILDSTQPIIYDTGGDYSFVCSSLLLSQLHAIMYDQAKDIARQRYDNDDFEHSLYREELVGAVNNFVFKSITTHFDLLRQSVRTDGRVYFSDTTEKMPIKESVARGIFIADVEDSREMLSAEVLGEQITQRFTPADEGRTWIWLNTPVSGKHGAAHRVSALSLKPK